MKRARVLLPWVVTAACGCARADWVVLESRQAGEHPDATTGHDQIARPDIDWAGGPLPEGNAGIAAGYKGDVGIASDPSVLFADDFESYDSAATLSGRWDAVYQSGHVVITTAAGTFYRGTRAVQFDVPQQTQSMTDTLGKTITPERDILFLRYYSKLDPGFEVASGHEGGMISAHYFVDGQATPGVPADGTNKFVASFEDVRVDASVPSPGVLSIYVYHPEQRSPYGDHFFPTGVVTPNAGVPFDFGPSFVARPDVAPELGQWNSYEFMVKANTPGKRDGRIACWFDGKLIADFPNLRLRDIDSLKIDRVDIMLGMDSNPIAVARKWYDNVVVATSYIGPLVD